jgi:hypothetical protein
MWAKSASIVLVARVVFLADSDQPTIRSHTEVSRLLHYRLEVIEAALLKLVDLQSRAATPPKI